MSQSDETQKTTPAEDAARPATLCVKTGRLAGEVALQVLTLKAAAETYFSQIGRLIYDAACPQAKALMKEPAPAGEAPQEEAGDLEQQRQELMSSLGAEVSRMPDEQVADAMSQPAVKDLVEKISAVDQAIAEPKEPAQEPKAQEEEGGDEGADEEGADEEGPAVKRSRKKRHGN